MDEATKEMCGQVIYPAAVLKAAPNAEAAREFLAYLQTDRAATVFESVGLHRTVNPLIFQSFPSGGSRFYSEVSFMDWYPLWNSLRIALVSCAAVFFLGTFCRLLYCQAAAHCQRRAGRGAHPAHGAAAHGGGLIFCCFCSAQKRPLGTFFMEHFGVKLVMNWYSAIFASIVVAFPLMYRTARGAFESFDETLAWSAQTLGQSDVWIFWRVRMPCCRQGILAGTVLAFARALGEYGATSMIAGYTPGKTATIATTVYQLWRTNDEAGAMRWVLVDIVISAVVLLAVNLLEKKSESKWPRMSLEVNITKKLDGFILHANFAARSTATAILGASGCGKSMTLRCIAGIVKPDAGRIVLDGRVLFDSAQHIDLPPQQRGVGLLFQNYALFPNMTVEQNVLCGLKAEKDKAARKARCAEMLQAMRLESLAKRYPAQLSGGQQQRTALARILVGRPKSSDAGRAVQCAGQLPARGSGGRSGQPAGRVWRHGAAGHPQP